MSERSSGYFCGDLFRRGVVMDVCGKTFFLRMFNVCRDF